MEPSIEARGVTKSFGQLVALSDVSIRFEPGSIHAVLGENGAGKSTLMSLLAGFLKPDRGEIIRRGQVAMVHQHFCLVNGFTVAENVALAVTPRLVERLGIEQRTEKARRIADSLGWKFDWSATTGELPVGTQQRIELIKALQTDSDVLILDEPTAVLSPGEIDELFAVLARIRESGKAVVLIAHKLAEVLAVADRISVLRRGKVVGETDRAQATEEGLARWMVGELPAAITAPSARKFEPVLAVEGMCVDSDRGVKAVQETSFELGRGEILGIGGVDGNGQIELAEALAGVRPATQGRITWKGPVGEVKYIPQDRQEDGLALEMSVLENLAVEAVSRREFVFGSLLRTKSIRRWSKGLIDQFEIKAPDADARVGSLSGGNQQKIVVARTLDSQPDVLVAVNPTRGLDIRATDFVHTQLVKAAELGCAVALFSTDLDELAALAHRTLFMSSGRLVEAKDAGSMVGAS